jgi:CheY-like chemotaxis protein
MLAKRMMERFGCTVTTANDGEEGLAAIAASEYDLVFMDCHMPRLDGYDAVRRLRKMGGSHLNLPVVAMTANALEGEREKCLAAGMSDFLPKPVDLKQMEQMLRRWLPKLPG